MFVFQILSTSSESLINRLHSLKALKTFNLLTTIKFVYKTLTRQTFSHHILNYVHTFRCWHTLNMLDTHNTKPPIYIHMDSGEIMATEVCKESIGREQRVYMSDSVCD